jgi:hypothetical protein
MTTELESLFREAPKKSRAAERETIIKDVVATTYAAGSDTTLSALLTFVLAIVLNPDVQTKAWAELDRVVPKDRLPCFMDRDQLPYITCIAWECLRWRPPVNIAPGHYLTEADEYGGYRIPKGEYAPHSLNAEFDQLVKGRHASQICGAYCYVVLQSGSNKLPGQCCRIQRSEMRPLHKTELNQRFAALSQSVKV